MNPDKLFDYLEGRLPAAERASLEQRLISDKQLQRELAVARSIHAGMRGDSREVLLPPRSDVTEQGRKMALRVGTAFIVLMAVNVGIGLWLIARHETNNPNRALLEKQMRNQITNSLEHAAASFTPAPLGVGEIMVPAVTGKLETVADEVVTIATRFGGSATKGLADQGRLSVLVDLPSNREPEFRAAILSMVGEATPGTHNPGYSNRCITGEEEFRCANCRATSNTKLISTDSNSGQDESGAAAPHSKPQAAMCLQFIATFWSAGRRGSLPLAVLIVRHNCHDKITSMIAVTFALPAESAEFLRCLTNKTRIERDGVRVIRGKIDNRKIEVLHTGVGEKVCRQRLENFYRIRNLTV